MDIKIVEPDIGDALGTIEVQYKAWLATYPNAQVGITIDDIEDRYKNAFSGKRLEDRERLISNPESTEKVIIAKDDNKVVGFCYGILKDDRNQLQAIYVLPEYHGKGVGTSLWNSIKKFFDPSKDTYVELAEYNTQALNFYKKLGFSDTGRRFQDERFRMKSGAIMPEMEMVHKAFN